MADSATMAEAGVAPSASFVIEPNAVDFGTVGIGTTGTAAFRVSNSGGATSDIPSFRLTGPSSAEFAIMRNACVAKLAPSNVCTFSVELTPTSAGEKQATLLLTAVSGIPAEAALHGTGVAPGALGIAPLTQSIGALTIGSVSPPARFIVMNVGEFSSGVVASQIVGSAELAIVNDGCTGVSLAPRAACAVGVVLTPVAAGPKNGTLQVGPPSGAMASATITGEGLAPATLTVSMPPQFEPTPAGMISLRQSVLVTNTGDLTAGTNSPVDITIAGPDFAEFRISGNGCGTTLPGHAACEVSLLFQPITSGSKTAELTVQGIPGSTTTLSVPLSATALGHVALLRGSATDHDFGLLSPGVPSPRFILAITNTGELPSGIPTIEVEFPTKTSFTTTCTAPIPGGGSCSVGFSMTVAQGEALADVTSMIANPGGRLQIILEATGSTPTP